MIYLIIFISLMGLAGLFIILRNLFTASLVVKTDVLDKAYKEGMVYYYLPESLIKITSSIKVAVYYNTSDNTFKSNRIIEQKFEVTTENIADTTELLSLKYEPSAFMSDDVKYHVSEKGLLESVNVTTENKAATIVNKITAVPKEILTRDIKTVASIQEDVVLETKEFSSDFFIKAAEIYNNKKELNWEVIILNERGKEEFKNIKASFSLEIKDRGLGLENIKRATSESNSLINGLLTRPLLNADLNITSLTKDAEPIPSLNVCIINQCKLINIPIQRAAFGKRVNDIIIKEGLIKSNHIINPSAFEEYVSIPINIIKAIVSLPSQLVTFRFDNMSRLKKLETENNTKEVALLKSEISRLANEKKLLEEIRGMVNELKK